jgi:hypothetical protein
MNALQAHGTDRLTHDRNILRQPALLHTVQGPVRRHEPTRSEAAAHWWPRFLTILLRTLSAVSV